MANILIIVNNNKTIIQKTDMHNRKYCCYRHFTQGKHEPSCTHCLTHVQLGVINPTHSPGKLIAPKQIPPLMINSKTFRIENRTHDYNEVENKDSLPERLRNPRLYVERVLEKGKRESMVLPGKISGSVEYEILVRLYRKIGESLPQKSKPHLLDTLRTHCVHKNYTKPSQPLFLSKFQFIQTILQCFKNFSHAQAQQFWQIGYNQLRFKDKISIQAFVYNFGKFYLSLINYNNTFSQAALRQRMIDLRVGLYEWAVNQVCFKVNIRNMRQDIRDIQEFLKLSQDQQLYYNFHTVVQNCKLAHKKLKFLAQVLFNLSDKKYLPLKLLKSSLHNKIQQRTTRLSTSRQILHAFFETHNFSQTDKFPITDIIQYCKDQDYDQNTMAIMISWVQGVFDYMFFYREGDGDMGDVGLGFNYETRRISCERLLEIDAGVVREFDGFLEGRFDVEIDVCRNLVAVVEGAMDKMPVLEGHKKQLVECNYLVQTVLRFMRQIDLSPLYWLLQIVQQSKYQKQLTKIKQILQTKPNEPSLKKSLKHFFTLHPPPSPSPSPNLLSDQSTLSQKDQIQYSINKFKRIKQQQLLLKLRETQQQKQSKKQKQYGEIQNLLREEAQREKSVGKGCQFCGDDHVQMCQKILQKDKEDRGEYGAYSTGGYLLDVSKDANTTISTIQSMESRLFNLLNISL